MKRVPLDVVTKADCKGCGACCRHMGRPVFRRYTGPDSPAEKYWTRLPRHLKDEIDAHIAVFEEEYRAGLREAPDDYGEPCIWLLPDGTCKHYKHRPRVCREFEVGGEACLRIRREQGIVPNRRQR
jgi:Fe-S-cluster containining protein